MRLRCCCPVARRVRARRDQPLQRLDARPTQGIYPCDRMYSRLADLFCPDLLVSFKMDPKFLRNQRMAKKHNAKKAEA